MVKISQTRIRSISNVSAYLNGNSVAFGVSIDENRDLLEKIGFSVNAPEGTVILPSIVWPITRFNAEWKEKIRRDLPKESYTREFEWTLKDWAGHTHSGVADITYMRYPRDFIAPPSIELAISGGRVVSPIFNIDTQSKEVIHAVNMFLEIFHTCDILDENLDDIKFLASKRVNWKILPPGRIPWTTLEREMKPILERQKPKVQEIFKKRFEAIEAYSPDFHVVGEGGFSGYVIFGFEGKKLFLCESMRHGNALYVFEEDWEVLSKKTKAEILTSNLQKDRIIHYQDWVKEIHDLLAA